MYHPKIFVASLTRSQPGFTVLAGSKLCAQKKKNSGASRDTAPSGNTNRSCGTRIKDLLEQASQCKVILED